MIDVIRSVIHFQSNFVSWQKCLSDCTFCGNKIYCNSFSIHASYWKKCYKSLPFLDHKEDDVPLKSQKSSGFAGCISFSDVFVGRSFHGLCSSTPLVTLMQARKERLHLVCYVMMESFLRLFVGLSSFFVPQGCCWLLKLFHFWWTHFFIEI